MKLDDYIKESLNYLQEGVQIYDSEGFLLYANAASENLSGFKFEDVKNKHLLEIYDLDEKYSTTLTVIKEKKPVINRYDNYKLKRGKELVGMFCGYPIFEESELVAVIVLEYDLKSVNYIQTRINYFEKFYNSQSENDISRLYNFSDIYGESKEIKDTIDLSKRMSQTELPILIYGETGTGKELFAQSIHGYSKRNKGPFIAINCASIPEHLFESLFYGTTKGAFTGSESKKGYFELSSGGTLFLDEVNSLSLDKQAKLLRVLEEKKYMRIGAEKNQYTDFRLICATNQPIDQLVIQEKFREDFYYRISSLILNIPSLRDRKSDIPYLAKKFLEDIRIRERNFKIYLSEEQLEEYINYNWPGNIRELKHTLEKFYISTELGLNILHFHSGTNIRDDSIKSIHNTSNANYNLVEKLCGYEKSIIKSALSNSEGNITNAAKILQISRQNLQHRIKRLKIDPTKYKAH